MSMATPRRASTRSSTLSRVRSPKDINEKLEVHEVFADDATEHTSSRPTHLLSRAVCPSGTQDELHAGDEMHDSSRCRRCLVSRPQSRVQYCHDMINLTVLF